jgi:Integrase core domain
VRFWLCLGVGVTVCPPHHPQTNGFVERYHRSYTEECLRIERPRTVEEVRTVTAAYREHYNFERPNQALSRGNRPPRVAFPALPARPSVPLLVDPDAWLETIDGRGYVRRVQENGCVVVGDAIYYVGRDRGGQEVAFIIDARAREFIVVQAGQELKRLAIKGLHRRIVPFDAFVELLATQARDNRSGRLRATG